MSQEKSTKEKKKQSRLKKNLKLIFSIVGVAGIVAIVQFVVQENRERELHQYELERAEQERAVAEEEARRIQEQRERERQAAEEERERERQEAEESERQREQEEYARRLEEWENFSPSTIGIGRATLRGGDRFDLETGQRSGTGSASNGYDLLFFGGPQNEDILRALGTTTWTTVGVRDFNSIKYRTIRDASYAAPRNSNSGYPDLFHDHRSNVPGSGYIYFIRTSNGNVGKIQILGYSIAPSGVMRDINIKYEMYPIVSDPPRP